MRDDTGEGTQGALVAAIQTRHAATLATLATQGLNTKALVVKPKPVPKPKAVADVAPRTALEMAWTDTVDSGASAGSNWLRVGAMAYTSPFLLSAELERKRQAEVAKEEKVNWEIAGMLTL